MNIEGAGLTLRIRERPADTAPPPKRQTSSFQQFIIDQSRAEEITQRLHGMIDGRRPQTCAVAIIAAIEAGLLTRPTYKALHEEFPEIGPRSNYAYYLSRIENYREAIDVYKAHLR